MFEQGTPTTPDTSDYLTLFKATGQTKLAHKDNSGTDTLLKDANDHASALVLDTATSTTAIPTAASLITRNQLRSGYRGFWTAVYDFGVSGTPGSIGTANLIRPDAIVYDATEEVKIPTRTFITNAYLYVMTTFASGGAATIALGVATDDTTGLLAATAFGGFTSGLWIALTPDATTANFTGITTGERNILMTIGGASITAGKFQIWFDTVTTKA